MKEDILMIGYDESKNDDHVCMIISRRCRGGYIQVINEFFDDEAKEMYSKLTTPKIVKEMMQYTYEHNKRRKNERE